MINYQGKEEKNISNINNDWIIIFMIVIVLILFIILYYTIKSIINVISVSGYDS